MPRGLEEKEVEKKVTETVEVVEAKPVEEKPDQVKTDAKEVHWTVPGGTSKVTLFRYDRNGKYLQQYSISSYISMKPGETFVIKAR